MYYNTNEEEGTILNSSRKNAVKQEDLVLGIFKKYRAQNLTPEEVSDALEHDGHVYPITSIRRAITDLTNKDVLSKTDHMRMGSWNKMTHAWRVK